MNKKRNRWLIAALGLAALFYFGDLAYRKLYEEPIRAQKQLKSQRSKKLRAAELDLKKAKRIVQQLELLEQRSLPADPELARSRYQAWLLDMVKRARLTNTNVDSGDPIPITRSFRKSKRPVELYKRFTFSVRGRGDLAQITRFLYLFYDAGHLHKIRSLSLNPVGDGQLMDVSASIEAISLPGADRDSELSQLPSNRLAQSDLGDYLLISRRNLFGRGGAHWAWKQIVLKAVTVDVQGVGEAWFSVSSEKGTQIIPVGEILSTGPVDLKVVEVNDQVAVVEIDGQRYRMTIGHSLADAAAVSTPAPPAPPASAPAPPAPAPPKDAA